MGELSHQNMARTYASHIHNNGRIRTSPQYYSIRHKYVLYSPYISAAYANIWLGQHQHLHFALTYAQHTLTMSNLTIADFDNAQVAGATNPSGFGHHYGEHMLRICPEEAYTNRSIQARSQTPTPAG